MILVRTRVAPSAIHGLGLFAVGAIPLGTPIWRFEPGFDREFSAEQFSALPPEAQAHLRWFAFLDKATGGWVLSGDHACFMNHSPNPNTGAQPGATAPVTTVALRNITEGEELTCDYWAFDAEAGQKLRTAASHG
jgi:SET domain-containing protein